VFSNLTQPISQGSPPAVSQSTNRVHWIECESTQSEFTLINLVRDQRTIRFKISAYSVGVHMWPTTGICKCAWSKEFEKVTWYLSYMWRLITQRELRYIKTIYMGFYMSSPCVM